MSGSDGANHHKPANGQAQGGAAACRLFSAFWRDSVCFRIRPRVHRTTPVQLEATATTAIPVPGER